MIRTQLLNRFSIEGSLDDPLLYTMTLNMTDVTMDKAEDLVVRLVQNGAP